MTHEIFVTTGGGRRSSVVHPSSGEQIRIDPSVEDGGDGSSFAPMDLLAAALGSCILTALSRIAERHAISLDQLRVGVTVTTNDSTRRLAQVRTRITVPTGDVPVGVRQRLEAAARTCPIHRGFHPQIDAPIEFVYA